MNVFAPASSRPAFRRIVTALALPLALVTFAAPAGATTIERVVSPGGIVAWLVHEPAVPMIAVDITPEFIREVQSHGFKNLDVEKLIELKHAGVLEK